MKVLHVIHGLWAGGAERVLVRLLPGLKKLGIDSEVAVLAPPYTLLPEIENLGFKVHKLKTLNKWNFPAQTRQIQKLAENIDADIVHANLLFANIYTGFSKMLGKAEYKTCTTLHNLAYAKGCNKRGISYLPLKVLSRIVLSKGMDAIFAVSADVAAHYKSELKLKKNISVIANPIDVELTVSRADESQVTWPDSTSKSSVKLVVPGRIVPEKGHAIFMETLKALKAQNFDFVCLLAGEGPCRLEVEELIAKYNLTNQVKITGIVHNDDMLSIISGADIVVIPSLFEGFGIVATEAMCFSKPIIASKVGGLKSLITHDVNGLHVKAGDPEDILAAILRLSSDDRLRKALGDNGYQEVQNRYGLEAVAKTLAGKYESLCQ